MIMKTHLKSFFKETRADNEFKNTHKQMAKVYKSLNCQNPTFKWDQVIREEVPYDLIAKDLLKLPRTGTVLNEFHFLQRPHLLELL